MRFETTESGSTIWLSAAETYAWAHRPGAAWPCSELSGKRLRATYDRRGDLVDYAVNGRYNENVTSNEFNACVQDHWSGERLHWFTDAN